MPRFSIDEETQRRLAPYGFDERALEAFAERVRAGAEGRNTVTGALAPPLPEDVCPLPAAGSQEHERLRALGEAALRRGEVGAVVLAGGMATRFGGVVKAVVPVLGARSFLELKHGDIRGVSERLQAHIPTLVMSSFSTHEAIEAHVSDARLPSLPNLPVEVFAQFVSLRLTPEGALFRDSDDHLSPYATGHGDLTFALRAHGILSRFRRRGGKMLVMSNVDNLAATLDAAVIGFHVDRGHKVTAEVVRKHPGDKGGAPARLDGVAQIVEGFRFPANFDQDSIPVFNTNTFVLDAQAIDRDFPLPFYRVEKQVDGRPAIQFERLVGEITAFLPTAFLEVEREGLGSRFLPAKDPQELATRLPLIRGIVEARRS